MTKSHADKELKQLESVINSLQRQLKAATKKLSLLKKRHLHENEMGDRMLTGMLFTQGGGVGLGTGNFDTFSSPDASQSANHFQYDSEPHKVDAYSNHRAEAPSDNDIAKLKAKGVTPDEVICGIDYEMKRMFHKNKSLAKTIVVGNLKKNPKFYSSLSMMNIKDIDENKSQSDKVIEAFRETVGRTIRHRNGNWS